MGYRIEYGQTAVKIQTLDRKKRRFPFTAVCAAVLLGALVIPKGREVVRDLILPGDGAVTAAALEGLAEDLRTGEPFGDAVTVFCQEIIAGGA